MASPASPTPALNEFRQHWRIALAALFGTCFGTFWWYTFGVFIAPLSKAFGWSNSALSAWQTFSTIGGMLAGPFIGRLADRFGVRPVVIISIPLLALSFVAATAMHGTLATMWLIAFGVGVVGSGAGYLPYSRAINSWFRASRGAALGVMYSGVGLSAFFGPRLIQAIIDAHGWRAGFLATGLATLLALPLTCLWLHERPSRSLFKGDREEEGLTRGQAMRLPVFWLLGAAALVLALCAGSLFYLIPFLTDNGLSRQAAATLAGVMGITQMAGRLVTGVWVDRWHAPYVCAIVFVAQGAAFAVLALSQAHHALPAVSVLGFALGAEVNCIAYCTVRYFGLKCYGEISGIVHVFSAVGNALGPLSFSLLHDASGSYPVGFAVWSAMAAAGAALLVWVGRYPFIDRSER